MTQALRALVREVASILIPPGRQSLPVRRGDDNIESSTGQTQQYEDMRQEIEEPGATEGKQNGEEGRPVICKSASAGQNVESVVTRASQLGPKPNATEHSTRQITW